MKKFSLTQTYLPDGESFTTVFNSLIYAEYNRDTLVANTDEESLKDWEFIIKEIEVDA